MSTENPPSRIKLVAIMAFPDSIRAKFRASSTDFPCPLCHKNLLTRCMVSSTTITKAMVKIMVEPVRNSISVKPNIPAAITIGIIFSSKARNVSAKFLKTKPSVIDTKIIANKIP